MTGSGRKGNIALRMLAVLGLGVAAGTVVSSGAPASADALVPVVVQGRPGARVGVQLAVRRLGGRTVGQLPVVDGESALVPAGRLAELASAPGVREVTPERRLTFHSIDPALGYDAARDFGSLYDITKVIGAQDSWLAGYTGKGVDVALLDTGVAPVPGLASGNVVNGPDLSFDSQDPTLTNNDGYGHGTHMASLIVGRDQAGTPASYADPRGFNGVAPAPRLISIKVGAADGSADVSQVVAGIDWVVQHAHMPGFNIRVLNLSFGTDVTQDYRLDPLAYAAEVAWRHGIVVVVSGSNDGNDVRVLADPARDPIVLAVGATDPMGTIDASDDTVPAFATRGDAIRHVDVVAPGVHVLGLRTPGSVIDNGNPTAQVGTRFFRGSGTSQSAALTSGAVALLLQRYPTANPDQIKQLVMASAVPLKGVSALYRGGGSVQVRKAEQAVPLTPAKAAQPTSLYGSGTGSLEGARGTDHVDFNGVALTGEQDIFGQAWVGSTWAPASDALRSWNGGTWNGRTWTGDGWTGRSWTTATWATTAWTGRSWTSTEWASGPWAGRSWTGSAWATAGWQ